LYNLFIEKSITNSFAFNSNNRPLKGWALIEGWALEEIHYITIYTVRYISCDDVIDNQHYVVDV